jgi:hypothetical protein
MNYLSFDSSGVIGRRHEWKCTSSADNQVPTRSRNETNGNEDDELCHGILSEHDIDMEMISVEKLE